LETQAGANPILGVTTLPKKPFLVPLRERNTVFFCDELAHTKPLEFTILSLMQKIASNSGRFDASSESVAHYLGISGAAVRAAMKTLRVAGWIEVLRCAPKQPTAFRPLRHDEWAVANPGLCCTKAVGSRNAGRAHADASEGGGRNRVHDKQRRGLSQGGEAAPCPDGS
jgi:hypothetical protein